jgi:hypothetical protein
MNTASLTQSELAVPSIGITGQSPEPLLAKTASLRTLDQIAKSCECPGSSLSSKRKVTSDPFFIISLKLCILKAKGRYLPGQPRNRQFKAHKVRGQALAHHALKGTSSLSTLVIVFVQRIAKSVLADVEIL